MHPKPTPADITDRPRILQEADPDQYFHQFKNGPPTRDVAHPTVDRPALLDEAGRAATRLWRQLGLPQADIADLRQDLIADLIRRLPSFDPERGSIGAFAGAVLRNEASRIAACVHRERRRTSGRLVSLDTLSEDGTSLGDLLTEADGLAVWQGQRVSDEAVIVNRLDMSRAFDALTAEEQTLCAASIESPIDALVERGLGARATIYRRLRNIHGVLAACGVAD